MRLLLLGSVAIAGATPAEAADWTGASSQDWFSSGNWNPASVPTSGTAVTIDNGGTATIGAAGAAASKVTLGSNGGQSGTLNVTGGTLTATGAVTVGDFGSGTLNLSNGGTVNAGSVYVAVDPGGNGTVTVSGSGSKLAPSALYIGMDAAAAGQAVIQNGATLSAGFTVLGYSDATANGTLTVSNATASTGSLTVGETGVGTFTLNGGSTGTSGSVTIGSKTTSNGTVNISGNGTTWSTGGISVGGTGSGTLTISNGAKVTSTQNNSLTAPVLIGDTATVTGAGSQWTIVGNSSGDPVLSSQSVLVLSGKANATGSLTVADGGKVEIAATASGTNGNFRQIRLGISSGATGALTVTGANSSFVTPYDIWAGFNTGTTGQITVSNGGALNTGWTVLGASGTGIAQVTGANSVWTIIDTPNVPSDYPHALQIAQSAGSSGVLTIADGGTVNVNSTGRSVYIGGQAGSHATLNIGADALSPAAAPGTLNADTVVFVTGADSTVNFNHTSSNYIFAPGIQGAGPGKVNFLSGTTILSGYNTYAGTTTISAGATAQFGNGGSNGIITGNIADDGALIFNTTSNTYGGVISGSGTVEQRGVGTSTLTLTGNNTYTGQTVISGGTLKVGNSGTTGTISNNVLNNAILMFDRSNNFTYNGVITGSGEFVKAGSGVMTLGGANSFTGGTSVQTGTLLLGGNNRLATTGSLFVFSGATFDLGGFNQTVGDLLSGPGTVAIGSGTFTAGTATDRTFAGHFTGNGAFVKQGSGSLTLTGNSAAYTGTTTVAAGTLAVNGDLSASAVTVNTGATLSGAGKVGATTVNGTVAPGQSNIPGTLNINGDYTQAAGSTLRVRLDNTPASDLLNISGAAMIQNGATVNVQPTPGLYAVGHRYTILTAASGRTGTYDNLVYNAPFLDLSLGYDPNSVFLDVTRSSITFQQVAQTPNQIAAAGGAESLGPGNPVYNSIVGLSATDARRAFDQVSGEIHASTQSAIIESSRFPRDAILGRLRQDAAGSGATQIATAALGDVDSALAYARTAMPVKAPNPLAQMSQLPAAPVYAAWAQGYGDTGRASSDGNAAAMARRTGGFISGIDLSSYGATSWRIGAAAGYQQSSLNVAERASSATIDTYNVALYGGLQHGPLGLRAGAAYGWNDIATQRAIVFPGFADSARVAYSAGTAQLFGEAGYKVRFNRATVEPFAALASVFSDTSRFTESGGAAALTGARARIDATFSTLGLRTSLPVAFHGGVVSWQGSLGWRHAFSGTPSTVMTFNAGGTPFGIAGIPVARDVLASEAGIDLRLSSQWSAGLFYTGQYTGHTSDHGARGQIVLRF